MERLNEKQPSSQVGKKKKNQYQMNRFLFPVWFIELFTRDLPGAKGFEPGEPLTMTAYCQYHYTLYHYAFGRTVLPPL